MTCRLLRTAALLAIASAWTVPASMSAQNTPADAPARQTAPAPPPPPVPGAELPDVPPPAPLPEVPDAAGARPTCDGWTRNASFRLGQNQVVRRDEAVRDVAVAFGSVFVEGRVCGDLFVLLGNLQLADGAAVEGAVTVVGGAVTVAPGAEVHGHLVLVGGAMDAPPQFRPGQEQVIVGIPFLGDRALGVVPWLTRGLLLGRLIVPDLAWVWYVVAVVLFVQLVLNLLFPHAAAASTHAIAERPLSTFAAGLLVLILAGPLAMLLAITVIGIAALPVLLCALAGAWIMGKIAVARWIGTRVVRETEMESGVQSTRSLLIGFSIVTVAYIVPVLGLVVWALTSVLGLGAATLAFVKGFRRENPPPAPRAVPAPVPRPVVPVPVIVPPVSSPEASEGAAPAEGQPAESHRPEGHVADAVFSPGSPVALLGFPRAGLAERSAAFALDTVLVVLTAGLLDLDDREGTVLVLLLAYHVAFWLWKATTLGGIICQLRVVRVDGQPLRFVDALVRALTAIFSLVALGLGALWILRDPERQSWHDKVAGTLVVRVPRNYPLP